MGRQGSERLDGLDGRDGKVRGRQSERGVGGQTLIATLIVIAIIAILAGLYFAGPLNPARRASRALQEQEQEQGQVGGSGAVGEQSTLGAVMERGKSVQCMNNLNQIRQFIVAESAEGEKPASLQDLNLPPSVQTRCPVFGDAYGYDPNTGAVKCPKHPNY